MITYKCGCKEIENGYHLCDNHENLLLYQINFDQKLGGNYGN